MAEVQWYYARNDQQFGPVSAAELKQLADEGKLSPDDLLWREGMDQWATAINLRGLFAPESAPAGSQPQPTAAGAAPSTPPQSPPAPARPAAAPRAGVTLRTLLRATQFMLWSLCVLVVLVGTVMFTRSFLAARDPSEEAAAAAVFATFFIAAYVLARSGESLARLLLARSRRRH